MNDKPNIIQDKIHFIYLEGEGFSFRFIHAMAILTARHNYPSSNIFVYVDKEPRGIYWDVVKKYVNILKVERPEEIFGNKISNPAHAADVLRLEILLQEGGIYFDLDTIIVKALDINADQKVVMGIQGNDYGLCNAFIKAPKAAEFLEHWYSLYRNFNPSEWDAHSVRLPYELSKKYKNLIHIEPRESFFKFDCNQDGLRDLYVNDADIDDCYSLHLWEAISKNYLDNISLESVFDIPTTINKVIKRTLESFPDILDYMRIAESEESVARPGKVFSQIYRSNVWGRGSGVGSQPENNGEYMLFLSNFIRNNGIRTVVDFGCGDWQFSKFINWGTAAYLGIDVVDFIVEENSKKFGTDQIKFATFGGYEHIPNSDLLVCKDVLQHFPNRKVHEFLENVRNKFKYLLITNDEEPAENQNCDITLGQFRTISLSRPPFSYQGCVIFSWIFPSGLGHHLKKSVFLMLGKQTD